MKYKKDKNFVIAIRLTEADLNLVDEIAAREHRTRSEILRAFITRGVNDGQKTKVAI